MKEKWRTSGCIGKLRTLHQNAIIHSIEHNNVS